MNCGLHRVPRPGASAIRLAGCGSASSAPVRPRPAAADVRLVAVDHVGEVLDGISGDHHSGRVFLAL